MKPSLFIGSSSESLNIAEKVQTILDRELEVTIWNQGVFKLNQSGFESLFNALDTFDYACFILADDDTVISRNVEKTVVRDNVLLELGLFLGKLGKNRVFVVYGRSNKPVFPSDLSGITFLDYDDKRKDKNLVAALTPICSKIKDETIKYGLLNSAKVIKNKPTKLRVEEVVTRGSSKFIDIIADSALYIADKKYLYKNELKTKILSKKLISSKYLYYTDEGCQHWLDICHKPEYKFYSNSIKQLGKEIKDIISIAIKHTNISEFDFISLGSGNGEKDNIILREMQQNITEDENIYFYPIDISDPMIVEAIRNSMNNNIDRNKVNVKAIVGDITTLQPLSKIYEERPNNNFFSILGNTIGNSDEKEMIESIRDAMFDGDVILIEFNTDQDIKTKESFYEDELNMIHDFVPLASLGVKFEKKKMKYENKPSNNSVVDGTITTTAYYTQAKIGTAAPVNNITLSIVHHYKLNKFKEEIEKRMNVKTLFSSEENGVGLILAQRQKSSNKS